MYIRKATIDDLNAIASLEADCFPPTEAADEAAFRDRLQVYPDHFWLLFEEDLLISFVNGMATDEADLRDEMYEKTALHKENGQWQMIFGVNTLPSRQRKGHAETVLRQVISDAKDQARKGLVLTCKEHMIHYYEKFGFINEGVSASVHGNVLWYQMRLSFK